MTGERIEDFDPRALLDRVRELSAQSQVLLSQRDRMYFDARKLREWLRRISESTEDADYLRRMATTALDLLPERDLTVRRLSFGPGGPVASTPLEIPAPDENC